MTNTAMGQDPLRADSPLRTPRSAAVAGIIFSVLLITALTLLRVSAPPSPAVAGVWLSDSAHRAAVAIGLNLVPFAGIAFLWFIGVLRDRIGEREDRFFATVFLGTGLLFVGMLFVAAAVAGANIATATSSGQPDSAVLALSRDVTTSLLNVYSMRMAAVFTLTTVTIARHTSIVSRWLTLAGLACAVVLMIGIGITPWVELLFPLWILALSLDILWAGSRTSSAQPLRSLQPRVEMPMRSIPIVFAWPPRRRQCHIRRALCHFCDSGRLAIRSNSSSLRSFPQANFFYPGEPGFCRPAPS